MRVGSIQTRIEYSDAPTTEASPTPATREIASTIVVEVKLVISSTSSLSSGE